MRLVSLSVYGRLVQQDRLAVRRHVLVLEGVEVASISRQVSPGGDAHQPNLPKFHITSRHMMPTETIRDFRGRTANIEFGNLLRLNAY